MRACTLMVLIDVSSAIDSLHKVRDHPSPCGRNRLSPGSIQHRKSSKGPLRNQIRPKCLKRTIMKQMIDLRRLSQGDNFFPKVRLVKIGDPASGHSPSTLKLGYLHSLLLSNRANKKRGNNHIHTIITCTNRNGAQGLTLGNPTPIRSIWPPEMAPKQAAREKVVAGVGRCTSNAGDCNW